MRAFTKRSAALVTVLLAAACLWSPPAAAITPGQLEEIKGTYAMEGSSQYTNGVLRLMYLGNNCCLFEFSMMEGSEAEDTSFDYCLSGVFGLEPDGTGSYESTGQGDLTLGFAFDGQTVTVTERAGGDSLPIHLAGRYDFTDSSIEVSELSAGAILEFLPPVATSLNATNRPYRLAYSPEMSDGYFYEMQAVHVPTETVLADFYIAWDMSAVYRVDDGGPVLIFGSAQPMLEAEKLLYYMDAVTPPEGAQADEDAGAESYYAPLVNLGLESESLTPGGTTQLYTVCPQGFSGSVSVTSSDERVATVDAHGVVTAKAPGEVTLNAALTIADATKEFALPLTVNAPRVPAEDTAAGAAAEPASLVPAAVGAAVLLAVGGVLLALKKRDQKKGG